MILDKQIRALEQFKANANKMVVDACLKNEGEITYLNHRKQMFEKGITSYGTGIIPKYQPSTVVRKRKEGLPIHVSLYETGRFHNSIKLKPVGDGVLFYSEIKSKGFDLAGWLEDRYGEQIFGLTDENYYLVLNKLIMPEIVNKFKKLIQ